MNMFICIPAEIQGAPTLAEVIAASLTTANLTGVLTADQQLIIKDAGGNDILVIDEATLLASLRGRLLVTDGSTPPNDIDITPGVRSGIIAANPEGSTGFYLYNPEDDGYSEMIFVGDGATYDDVMSAGVGGSASAAPYTLRGYFYTGANMDGLLFQAGGEGKNIRFDAGPDYDNPVATLDEGEAGATSLMLLDFDNATLQRVSIGAADSGGAGYRVLRVPN